MDLELVITRLTPLVTAKTLTLLGGSADLAGAQLDAGNGYPAAYVIPLAERGGQNNSATMFVRQKIDMRFGVLLAVKNWRDAVSRRSLNDLKSIKDAVRASLIGWLPTGCDDLVTFGSGKLVRIQDGILWWQEEYLTAFYLRSQ